MGAAASVSVTSLSSQEVGQAVATLGEAYEPYEQLFVQNGIDGSTLTALQVGDLPTLLNDLGIQNTIHKKVLATQLQKILGSKTSSGSSDTGSLWSVPTDFRMGDHVTQSPRELMSKLFQIQGIALDPKDKYPAIMKIQKFLQSQGFLNENRPKTNEKGEEIYDCFINYRVAAEADTAEMVYLDLKSEGIRPFLDKRCLRDGMPWREGFISGLMRSRCFIALISSNALAQCRDANRDHSYDNVLLEYETALKITELTGNKSFICPVLVGEYDESNKLSKFSDFNPTLYAEKVSPDASFSSVSPSQLSTSPSILNESLVSSGISTSQSLDYSSSVDPYGYGGGSSSNYCPSYSNSFEHEIDRSLDRFCVVMDIGTGSIKAGFGGEDAPRYIIPTVVGTPMDSNYAAMMGPDKYVGDQALEKAKYLTLQYPMARGIFTEWDSMIALWEHIFTNELRIDPSESRVILSIPPFLPDSYVSCLIQIFFGSFGVQSLYIGDTATFSILSTGRTSGLVIDSGYGCTYAAPVFEAAVLSDALNRTDIGGDDVTSHFGKLLSESGNDVDISKSTLCYIKEKTCYVAMNFDAEMSECSSGKEFELPDGNVITLGAERFLASEILFNPMSIGREQPSVQDLAYSSLRVADRDEIYQNCVIVGGNSLLNGFADRISHEVQSMANRRVKVTVQPDRAYAAFIGASITACLSSKDEYFVTSDEYEKNGMEYALEKFKNFSKTINSQ
jgi:actin